MIGTKAEILYDFATKVIRQYTIYTIVRENFESQDFNQSMWEMWETIGVLYDEKENYEDEVLKEIIAKAEEKIINNYWEYINKLIQEILSKSQPGENRDDVRNCLERIEQMRQRNIIDVEAVKEVRKLEEIIY